MVRKDKSKKSKAGPAKQPLDLAELAAHDDVCSDVMVDNAFYRFKIRKYRPKHIPVRGIKEEEIPKILLKEVIVGKDPAAAEKILLNLPGLKRYQSTLKNKAQKEHFVTHLRKYIHMYCTDCAWEVSSTNRYTITTYEAAVTARKRIRQGELIKYLTGTLVPLTTEESADLDTTNRNFSIVVNARTKSDQMFLGPARFANHDCNSNARLQMEGQDSMKVVATRNIGLGEEITVSYGDNYFGPDNVECLCGSCEAQSRNGWTSRSAFTKPESGTSTPVPSIPVSLRGRKRKGTDDSPDSARPSKRTRTNESSDATPSEAALKSKTSDEQSDVASTLKRKRDDDSSVSVPALKRAKNITSPSKLQYSWTPPSTSESEIGQEDMDERQQEEGSPAPSSKSKSSQKIGKGRYLSSPKFSKTESNKNKILKRSSEERQTSLPLSPSTTSPSSQDSEADVAIDVATNVARVPVTIKVEQVEKITLETDENAANDTIEVVPRENKILEQTPAVETEIVAPEVSPLSQNSDLPESVHAATRLSITKVSTIVSIEPTDDDETSTVVPSIETKTATHASLTVVPVSSNIRIPGDYVLTRALLAQPHDRWVRCQNDHCHSFFLQANGYQTRRECPRCERHSMLYGFTWPKTDPDPRALLARQQGSRKGKGRDESPKFSAYRRQGKSGKGTWVEGGGDDEERVMDHRTIHRFVLPEDEREMTRKGLLLQADEVRKLGEDDLAALKNLDGRGRKETSVSSREGTRDTSIGVGMGGGVEEFMRAESADNEGRRRSSRITESRVYVNVDMKR